MKIAFPCGTLTYRGTHVATYDYAYFNQKILGNESLIFINESCPGPEDIVKKFQKQFECIFVNDWTDVSKKSALTKCDACYIIKSGEVNHEIVSDVPSLIHAVFPQKLTQQHGSIYAFVSEWLSIECSNGKIPFVPHMIHLPQIEDDLRIELSIPTKSTVMGCYGGYDSFDIYFVKKMIEEIVSKKSGIYFCL